MTNSWFELQVLVSGRPVREYGQGGRVFVEGRCGSPFTIKFRNSLAVRVLAVPSVDGLSVIDGNPATGTSGGYVVPGYSAFEIKGWRRDLGTSADFVFTERAKSYAAQTAGAQNLGVIAVKVFAEKVVIPAFTVSPVVQEHHHHHYPPPTITFPHWWTTVGSSGLGSGPQYTCSVNLSSASGVVEKSLTANLAAPPTPAPAFNLGTGWGTEKSDLVSECSFERGAELATLEIYYDDAAGLSAFGVQLTKEVTLSAPSFPVAFGFCKPPGVKV